MTNLLIWFCLLIGGLIFRALLGFGFSLFFVPLATLKIGFPDAVRLAIAYELIVSCLMAYTYRKDLHLLDALWLEISAIAGAGIGFVVKSRVDPQLVVAASMIVIIVLCFMFLWRISFTCSPSPAKAFFAGSLSGVLNTWSSLSGPPVVIYFLATERSAASIKGRLSGFFVLLYAATASLFLWRGEYAHFHYSWALLIGSILLVLAYPVVNRVALTDLLAIRRGALVFIIVASALVLVRVFRTT
jgi:uncharacterized protein